MELRVILKRVHRSGCQSRPLFHHQMQDRPEETP
jgi:hypothetical protein